MFLFPLPESVEAEGLSSVPAVQREISIEGKCSQWLEHRLAPAQLLLWCLGCPNLSVALSVPTKAALGTAVLGQGVSVPVGISMRGPGALPAVPQESLWPSPLTPVLGHSRDLPRIFPPQGSVFSSLPRALRAALNESKEKN